MSNWNMKHLHEIVKKIEIESAKHMITAKTVLDLWEMSLENRRHPELHKYVRLLFDFSEKHQAAGASENDKWLLAKKDTVEYVLQKMKEPTTYAHWL